MNNFQRWISRQTRSFVCLRVCSLSFSGQLTQCTSIVNQFTHRVKQTSETLRKIHLAVFCFIRRCWLYSALFYSSIERQFEEILIWVTLSHLLVINETTSLRFLNALNTIPWKHLTSKDDSGHFEFKYPGFGMMGFNK